MASNSEGNHFWLTWMTSTKISLYENVTSAWPCLRIYLTLFKNIATAARWLYWRSAVISNNPRQHLWVQLWFCWRGRAMDWHPVFHFPHTLSSPCFCHFFSPLSSLTCFSLNMAREWNERGIIKAGRHVWNATRVPPLHHIHKHSHISIRGAIASLEWKMYMCYF